MDKAYNSNRFNTLVPFLPRTSTPRREEESILRTPPRVTSETHYTGEPCPICGLIATYKPSLLTSPAYMLNAVEHFREDRRDNEPTPVSPLYRQADPTIVDISTIRHGQQRLACSQWNRTRNHPRNCVHWLGRLHPVLCRQPAAGDHGRTA